MHHVIVIERKSDDDFTACVMQPTGSDKIGEMFVNAAQVDGRSEAQVKERALAVAHDLFGEVEVVIAAAEIIYHDR